MGDQVGWQGDRQDEQVGCRETGEVQGDRWGARRIAGVWGTDGVQDEQVGCRGTGEVQGKQVGCRGTDGVKGDR